MLIKYRSNIFTAGEIKPYGSLQMLGNIKEGKLPLRGEEWAQGHVAMGATEGSARREIETHSNKLNRPLTEG